LGGPAYATAALTTIGFSVRLPPRLRAAALVAGATAAAAGSYDDLRGSARIRGLRGHLRALLRGEPTSGAVKVGAIGVGALAAGCLTQPGSWRRKAAAGVVIAGSANLANLLDLRPGRATKVGLMVAGPLAFGRGGGARVAAAAAGAATGLLPLDLRETTMLGDTGANTMGALIGVGLVQGASARRLTCALVALLGLTAASEFVSFSRVIEENATLRSLDALGRRGE
jgi:UDP-N-acetylmuramyl pentapeptide phosphotransferase/UDP-N-acetylglucosamine-1-phosphate transferase